MDEVAGFGYVTGQGGEGLVAVHQQLQAVGAGAAHAAGDAGAQLPEVVVPAGRGLVAGRLRHCGNGGYGDGADAGGGNIAESGGYALVEGGLCSGPGVPGENCGDKQQEKGLAAEDAGKGYFHVCPFKMLLC